LEVDIFCFCFITSGLIQKTYYILEYLLRIAKILLFFNFQVGDLFLMKNDELNNLIYGIRQNLHLHQDKKKFYL